MNSIPPEWEEMLASAEPYTPQTEDHDDLGIEGCPRHRYVSRDGYAQDFCCDCGRETKNPTILGLIGNAKRGWALYDELKSKLAEMTIENLRNKK